MSASLRALLTEVIDYAGLFPPAQLPLDQAIRNYARYRQEPEAWMLGRFICPAARLTELAPFVDELFAPGRPLALSALGDWPSSRSTDAAAIAEFRSRHGQRVVVGALEVRRPVDLLDPEVLVQTVFQIFFTAVSPGCPQRLAVYLEAPLGPAWRTSLPAQVHVLPTLSRTTAAAGTAPFGPCGFKLRCGGLEASAFPSPEQVALVITACRDAGVPLKFTAGLHHPIRHFDAGLQTKMHGFLNVFVAGVLAHARRLSEEQVRQVNEDEDAGHFAFDDAGLRWKDLGATTDEIITARRELVTSFGSCSFDEPRDDLRALGLLP